MKIKIIPIATAPPPPTFSFEEIAAEPGIYRPVTGYAKDTLTRLVTIAKGHVFYMEAGHGYRNPEQADFGWKNVRFERTNETLAFVE